MARPLKILLVDDQAEIRLIIRSILIENYEVVVLEASNGQEASWKLANDEFDLLITDIRMPKFSGIELIKALSTKDPKKRPKKIILISGFIDSTLAGTLKKRNMEVLLKPLDEETFMKAMDNHLERKIAA